MKNTLKKAIVTVVAALSLAASLTSCSGQVKGTCQACRLEKPLYEVTLEATLMGYSDSTSHKLCKDCADFAVKTAKSAAKESGAKLTSTVEKLRK